jgi:hypothetical protein
VGSAAHLEVQRRWEEGQGAFLSCYLFSLSFHTDAVRLDSQSKGNHIWTVEAKKMPDKQWLFREFTRCIKGQAPPTAFVGVTWVWQPRVWDPQCSSSALEAHFMSPSLPPWLQWDNNVLSGEAPESEMGQDFEVEAVATFQMGNKVHQLKATTSFRVASPNDTDGSSFPTLFAFSSFPD